MVERLFLKVPRGCLQFVIVVFPDHTHLLFLVRTAMSLASHTPGMDIDKDTVQNSNCLAPLVKFACMHHVSRSMLN